MRPHPGSLVAPGAVLAGALFYLYAISYFLRFPFEGSCWFYAPDLGERSPSEFLTVVAWLVAAAIAVGEGRRSGSRGWWVLGLVSFAMMLEESNYGRGIVGLFQRSGEFDEGLALHNLVEARYQQTYWDWESAIQVAVFTGTYLLVPAWVWVRTRHPVLVALASVPALIWGYFSLREAFWVKAAGVPLYPHHPCVSIDEEIYESLFALSCAGFFRLAVSIRRRSHPPAPPLSSTESSC